MGEGWGEVQSEEQKFGGQEDKLFSFIGILVKLQHNLFLILALPLRLLASLLLAASLPPVKRS